MTQESQALEAGAQLAGYTIERPLGRGGMGAVYVATDNRLKRRVALKVLAPELAQDASFRERFIRESELAAALDHPSVVPIFDANEQNGVLFIAMRYVEGADLGAHLREQGPLSLPATSALIDQIAGALDAAHAAGLIHRDVKPQNILVDRNNHAYLTDFGVAKRTSSGGTTKTGMFLGSVDYAAPEQLEGKALDGRADVYALGCVTYQCLSGETPFPRDSEVAVVLAHLKDPPPSFAPLHSELAGLDAVIGKALAKDPAERYTLAGDLASALKTTGPEPETAAAPTVPAAPTAPAQDRLGVFVRSLATQAGLRAGVLLGLAAVVVPALIVFALSLTGIASLQIALGTRYQPNQAPSVGVDLARSLFAPWLVRYSSHTADALSTARYLALPATAVLVLVFVAGRLRLRHARGSTRLIALVTAAVTSALLVGLLAKTISYHTLKGANTASFSYPAGAYVSTVLVEALLAGFLTLGIVRTWREPVKSAVRLATILASALFLAAAVAFPLLTVAGGAPHTQGHARLLRDIAVSGQWAGGVGGAALPLAFETRVSLQTAGGVGSPFSEVSAGLPGIYTYRPVLATFTGTHSSARLFGYAGTGGVLWRIAALLASLAVVIGWVLASVLLVRRLGAPRAIDGLRHGLVLGAAGAVVAATLAWLSPARFSLAGADGPTAWGFQVRSSGVLLTVVELVLLTGASGLVYAALRPSAYRYSPWKAPARTPRPKVERPRPAAAPAANCAKCGTAFGSAGEQFCMSCGTARPKS